MVDGPVQKLTKRLMPTPVSVVQSVQPSPNVVARVPVAGRLTDSVAGVATLDGTGVFR